MEAMGDSVVVSRGMQRESPVRESGFQYHTSPHVRELTPTPVGPPFCLMGRLLGGGALVALAAFMLLGFFNLSQPLSFPVAALTLLGTVVVPGGAGAALLRAHFRER